MRLPARSNSRNLLYLLLVIVIGAGGLGLRFANASSVAEVAVGELVAGSELIFEGKVRHVEAREEGGRRHIWTRVTYDVVDVIKGEVPSQTVSLDFLGGTYNGKTLQVTDLKLPEVGEHGIYFVESPKRHLVHPLYGWAQGHFRIVTDSQGVERVSTADARPVFAIERTGAALSRKGLSTGVARGVITRQLTAASDSMSLTDFKRRLREIMGMP